MRQRMERVLGSLAGRMAGMPGAPPLLAGTGRDDVHLIVVASSDRGLAGGFNASILREARRRIRDLDNAGKTVKLLTVGRKGRDSLRRDYGRLIHDSLTDIGRRRVSFDEARDIAGRILALYEAGEFDVCSIIFNRFRSAMTQIVTVQQLIPFAPPSPPPGAEGTVETARRRDLRIRAERRGNPDRAVAEQSRGADLYRAAGKRGQRAGRADDRDGQRDAQRRRDDRPADR